MYYSALWGRANFFLHSLYFLTGNDSLRIFDCDILKHKRPSVALCYNSCASLCTLLLVLDVFCEGLLSHLNLCIFVLLLTDTGVFVGFCREEHYYHRIGKDSGLHVIVLYLD